MQSKWLLPLAIIISLIIHLCLLLFFDLSSTGEGLEEENKEPIEIEFLPDKKEELNNIPKTIEPYVPEDDPQETTLDHDLPGGATGGPKVPEPILPDSKPAPKPKPMPIPKPSVPIFPPSSEKETVIPKTDIHDEEVTMDTDKPDEDYNEKSMDSKSIFDTKEITDRIANRKTVQPAGEDTASYNVFQERYASYFSKFRRRVYQLWEYPQAAAARGEKGTVSVTFSILKDGSVVNIKMTQSSGYPELDREVMRVLKNIGKIPLPESYNLDQLNVDEAYFIYIMGKNYGRYLQ